ncbi:MAG: hypothetical protein PWQ61_534 [Betaproteobacteria bacterium]|nr:hypothetical protein [Betaproteobacteria bacterium]
MQSPGSSRFDTIMSQNPLRKQRVFLLIKRIWLAPS